MFFLHILILYHLLEEVIFTLYYLYTTTTEYAEALKTDKERGKPAKQEKPSIRAQLKAAKEQTPKKQAKQKTQDLERS